MNQVTSDRVKVDETVGQRGRSSGWRGSIRHLVVACGAGALTLVVFLILPLIQTIATTPNPDMLVREVDTAAIPPPPPPPEERPERKEEHKKEPPELQEEAPPLDLSQLELALNPGVGDGLFAAGVNIKRGGLAAGTRGTDELFSMSDLDQKPRVIYQPSPIVDARAREKAPGTVYIIFVVDEQGRVESPKIQRSTGPIFEKPALTAVKQWRFEPGKRKGKPVRFRMRVPITFPEQ